jgi:mRNA-degrading endonuclease RelE of RelBE toxin-antitoxin system
MSSRDAPAFSVLTTAHFDRLMKKLAPRHPDLLERFEETILVLAKDPHNKTGKYPIKKLRGLQADEGQYRLRSGRFRFRYDIAEREVILLYCGLRREDTY